MAQDPNRTVRIQRRSRIAEDSAGRNVWVGRVEEAAELELVSTTALEKILGSADTRAQVEIRKLAESGKDGLLARDAATGRYEIVSDEELRSIAETGQVPPPGREGAVNVAAPLSESSARQSEELSLVSTMMLRKVIGADGRSAYISPAGKKQSRPKKAGRDQFGGFDPYDKS